MCQWFSAVIFFRSFNITCLPDCLWSLLWFFFQTLKSGMMPIWSTTHRVSCCLGTSSSYSHGCKDAKKLPCWCAAQRENGSGIKRCQSSVATHLNRENVQLEVVCSGCFSSWDLGSRAHLFRWWQVRLMEHKFRETDTKEGTRRGLS